MKKVENYISYAYILAIAFVLAFYYDNGFFNMLLAKAVCYRIIAIVFFMVVVGIVFIRILKMKTEPEWNTLIKKIDLLDIAVVLFTMTAVLSCIFSYNRVATWWGSDGWNVGAFTYVMLCVFYFFVSRTMIYNENIIGGIFASSASIIFLLGMLNSMLIDPLGMQEKLRKKDLFKYSATMGNINTYAGYISMIVPFILYMCVMVNDNKKEHKKSIIKQVVYHIALFLGFCNVFTCNSDGVYLGIGFSMFFILYYISTDINRLKKYLMCIINYSLAATLVKVLKLIRKDKMVKIDSISGFILNKYIFVYVGLIAIVFILAIIYLDEKSNVDYSKVLSVVRKVEITIFSCGSVFVLIDTIRKFNDKWGTKRGFLWKHAIKVFGQLDFKGKIIGYGPDSFGIIINKLYNKELKKFYKLAVLNAHNEFLQYLITLGIIGLVAFILIWFSVLRKIVKERKKINRGLLAYFGALGYMGQAIVNNPQTFNVAVLFLLLSIGRNVTYREKNEQENIREIF